MTRRDDEKSLLRALTRTLHQWTDWHPGHAVTDQYGAYARWARHTPTDQRYLMACKKSLYGGDASFMRSLPARATDNDAYLALAVGDPEAYYVLGDVTVFDPEVVREKGSRHRVVSKRGVEVTVWHISVSEWGVGLGGVVSGGVLPGLVGARSDFVGQSTLPR